MKIVVSANTSWNIVNFRAGVVRALIADGHEIIALTPEDGFEDRLAALGCRHIPLDVDSHGLSPIRDLKLLYRYLLVMRREQPDALLCYTIKPNIYGSLACASLSIPVINNVSGLGATFIQKTWLTRVVRMMYRLAFRKSSRVFFQNPEDQSLFLKHHLVKATQTELLPGSGVDLNWFSSNSKPVERSGTTFLMIARLLRDKGVLEYAWAARSIRKENPDTRFQLMGSLDHGNRNAVQRSTLHEWIDEGVIDYLGEQDDVRPAINEADCVVLPSYREGTPRSLLEAAAMSKPLIATEVRGCRNVVTNGVNGYLCEAKRSNSLTEAIMRFLASSQSTRERMGKQSRQIAENKFDEDIVVNAYRRALDGIPHK